MEEAYTELYREFIRLRSLCLKQAALLQQLTEALQNRQGSSVPNGGSNNLGSVAVQCTQDSSVPLHDGPEPLIATTQNPQAQHGSDGPSRGAGTFSDLLAEDMGRLGLDVPNPREKPRQADRSVRDETLQMFRMPWACTFTQDSDFLSQAGGIMMSELALQSQVCEFCHAVFPGHTTTRGEYLRHLHTHIT